MLILETIKNKKKLKTLKFESCLGAVVIYSFLLVPHLDAFSIILNLPWS